MSNGKQTFKIYEIENSNGSRALIILSLADKIENYLTDKQEIVSDCWLEDYIPACNEIKIPEILDPY